MLFSIGNPVDLTKFSSKDYFGQVYNMLTTSAEQGQLGEYGLVAGVPFPFDPAHKTIGVNFSAGADSTALLYTLCSIIDMLDIDVKIKVISVVRYYKTAQYSERAKEAIFAELQQRFPNVDMEHVWGFIPPALEFTSLAKINLAESENINEWADMIAAKANADVLFFRQFSEWTARKYNLDAVYNGTTTNPTTQDLTKAPEFRNIQTLPNTIHVSASNLSPFEYLEKSFTTSLYDNFGITDLFDMTHSCDDTEQGCGVCFHCEERQWSIDNKHLYLGETNEL